MTTERFRQLLKRFHPDTGGSPRYQYILRSLLDLRRRQVHRFNHCWCGVAISARSRRCGLHVRRNAFAMLSCVLALLLPSCATKPKTLPPLSRTAPASPITAAAVAPPTNYALAWDWSPNGQSPFVPLPYPGITFEVQESKNLKQWTYLGRTNKPPFQLGQLTNRSGFWRVWALPTTP